ncbi:MAG: hypothetical protein F6K18_12780 [Okeania sp. SIO2C2]|uniref:hypothetical protein n=1 Tax=Okeania sp. SIO2C2 TaxID=2607787 RepID=UPI0013BB1B33|nr:hypothetical protein [Okeania sp. SIO2C2]NEP87620.1 hypothetical protein [Okeania sp. SIO2C2]
MARNYLQALAKAASKALGPLGSPIEFFLSLNQDKQTQKQKDELYAMILEGQNLTRETLEEILKARSEIKELKEEFILAVKACSSILAQNRKLLSSQDLEQNIPFLIEIYKEKLEENKFVTNNEKIFMASLFQEVLDEIRKRSGKYQDIKDIERKIINNLVEVYQRAELFIYALEQGGFYIGNLNLNQPLRAIVEDFLSKCNAINVDKLYKIFSKLYEQNKGLTLLKEIRYRLEKIKNEKKEKVEESGFVINNEKIFMASLFQEVLDEIRKRRGKYEDIEKEITNEILGAYNE